MKPIGTTDPLFQRRLEAEARWQQFTSGADLVSSNISDDIQLSWQLSSQFLPQPTALAAPTTDTQMMGDLWQQSPLRLAAQQEREQMKQLAQEGSLVVALADAQGRLLWTYASNHMRRRAEEVNFVAGGHWGEAQMGTNAVGLAARLQHAVTVFSAEHYRPNVHDWVCYAAPIIHPQTQETVGVLDISSTWRKHTPLGQMAVSQLAQSIANRLPSHIPLAELEIRALGGAQITYMGMRVRVSQRQLEMLCLLALNPQGLNLEAFHAALYGDEPVALSTLKAELSHLRRILDGKIGSRPYRLLCSVWADFIQVWGALRKNDTDAAFSLYRGIFLPQSNSPELESWRHCIEAVMGKALESCHDTSILLSKLCLAGSNTLVRERLIELAELNRL